MLADLQLRVPGEHLVDDHRGHRVVDGAVVEQHLIERILLAESLERRLAAPQRGDRQVAAVGQVEAHRNARFGQPRPHRIVQRIAQRARLDHAGHRRGPHQTILAPRPSTNSTSSTALSGSASEMIGAADDPVVGPVEAPVLVEPQVERVHRRHRRVDVVLERFLDTARERRQHEHRLDVLLVHHLDPGIAVLVLGMVCQAGRPSSATPGRRLRGSRRGTADPGSPAR